MRNQLPASTATESRARRDSDALVVGYGSLMSGLGLQPLGRIRARAAGRLAFVNARRGFGKFSQHGDRFAMVLEAVDPGSPIEAYGVPGSTPPKQDPGGIALVVQANDLARLAEREGYSSGALQRLREEASRQGRDLPTFLWSIFAQVGFDVTELRKSMFRLVGYTSPHYVPHPVRVHPDRIGLTFLAPGAEGSGADRVVPVRMRTKDLALMSMAEAWKRKSNRTQLAYFVACLLGGVHGVWVGDLTRSLVDDRGLRERLRLALAEEQRHELPRFLHATGLDQTAYWQNFGPPARAVRYSGLSALLEG